MFALQVKKCQFSLKLEVRPQIHFFYTRCKKSLNVRLLRFPQPKEWKASQASSKLLLHPKKANFQLNAALWCAVYLQEFSLDPELLQQKTLGTFILLAEQYTVRPPCRSIWKLSPHHWTQTMFLRLQPYTHPNNGNGRRLLKRSHAADCLRKLGLQ